MQTLLTFVQSVAQFELRPPKAEQQTHCQDSKELSSRSSDVEEIFPVPVPSCSSHGHSDRGMSWCSAGGQAGGARS